MSVSPAAEDPASDGDSDASVDAPTYEAYYRPISVDAESDEDNGGDASIIHSNGDFPHHHVLLPSFQPDRLVNGLSRLDLNDDDEEEEAAHAEEREREVSMSRAFSEDENRRNAPLTQENAARIIEAMRGVTFPGCPPAWVDIVPEDRWAYQLGRLREGQNLPSSQS